MKTPRFSLSQPPIAFAGPLRNARRVCLLRCLSCAALGMLVLGGVYANSPDANIWPNGSFENGSDLDSSSPTLEGWSSGGSNLAIDVLSGASAVDGAYALAVRDEDPAGYGEWYSELSLTGLANEGDTLEVSWSEMYAVDSGEMRLTILFFNGGGGVASQSHFVTRETSAGWTGSVATSPFVDRMESIHVPPGSVRMTVSLVSGGPSETTGFMAIDALCIRRPQQPVLLPGNFWPNATFEEGENLEQPTGSVADWNRGGSDGSIGQITGEVSVSPAHSLVVRDENAAGYGEWYADVSLVDQAMAGDTLQLQWFEIFSVAGGEMRLTSVFFDQGNAVVGERHFTVTGESEGWRGDLAGSAFSRRNDSLTVPDDAVTLRMALVSGGSEATTGVFAIDDLSIIRAAVPQTLAGNFWDNPGFEEGAGLDAVDGTLSGWNRGGSAVGIDQITDAVSLSPLHALAVVDDSSTDFGEWYADRALDGLAEAGDVLDMQWFEIFDVSENGAMRVTVLFFAAEGSLLSANHYETRGQSGGWSGELATSTFALKTAQLIVPDNAATMRVSLVSGGPVETTGVMVIDDLSVSRMPQGAISPGNIWPNPTFELGSQLDNPGTASPAGWNRGGSNSSINVVVSENAVSPSHALAVIDNDAAGYGEWYQSIPLGETVAAGDDLFVQWFEMFSTDGDMRLSFLFFDASGAIIEQKHFIVSGESDEWQGDIASSSFTPREEFMTVPAGATRLQAGLVSGGALAVLGSYVIDDLSISPPVGGPLAATAFVFDPAQNMLTLRWQSRSSKTYSIEFSSDLENWEVDVESNIPATGPETSHSFRHPGVPAGFFRVLEE